LNDTQLKNSITAAAFSYSLALKCCLEDKEIVGEYTVTTDLQYTTIKID